MFEVDFYYEDGTYYHIKNYGRTWFLTPMNGNGVERKIEMYRYVCFMESFKNNNELREKVKRYVESLDDDGIDLIINHLKNKHNVKFIARRPGSNMASYFDLNLVH